MSRYFYHLHDGPATVPDAEGTEFQDDGTAQQEANRMVLELLSAGDRTGLCRRHWRMTVVNDEGREVFSLPFSGALRPDFLDRRAAQD